MENGPERGGLNRPGFGSILTRPATEDVGCVRGFATDIVRRNGTPHDAP